MYSLEISGVNVYSDYVVTDNNDKVILINLLERSKSSLQCAVSNMYKGCTIFNQSRLPRMHTHGDYRGYIETFQVGKTKYYQSLVKSNLVYSKTYRGEDEKIDTILIENEHQSIIDVLYEAIYNIHDLPIIKEWSSYLYERLTNLGNLSRCRKHHEPNYSYNIQEGSMTTDLCNWEFYNLKCSFKELDKIVSDGLRARVISISNCEQASIEATSIDEYFQNYGSHIIENVLESLKPKMSRTSLLDYKFKAKTPFPIQSETINAAVNHLRKEPYLILNGSMGVGKTFMSLAIPAIMKEKSRTVIMAPGHMLEKWKEEILEEVPTAKVEIVRTFSDVVKMKNLRNIKPTCTEYYIFSKDFAKLSYEKIPTVTRKRTIDLPMRRCDVCNLVSYDGYQKKDCTCGSSSFTKIRSDYELEGIMCPNCTELIFQKNVVVHDNHVFYTESQFPLDFEDFKRPSNKNSHCPHCGTDLWQPNVRNLELNNEYSKIQNKKQKWMKVKTYSNMSRKTMITNYITKEDYQTKLEEGIYHSENHSIVKMIKNRKYSPSLFIKNHLGRDFFQFGLFDECHLYKSGGTAQSQAFDNILQVTTKAILLTGTLAGGVATDLFYLLYRVDPRLMLENGYGYNDVMKFASDYGVIEERKEFEDETVYYNRTSSGRSLGAKSIKPGISPLLYSQLLMNNTIFLDLSDFKGFLSRIEEYPVGIEMEKEQKKVYDSCNDMFVSNLRAEGGMKLRGQLLPTMLSLPDVNQIAPIIHPLSGIPLFSFNKPREEFYGEDGLLNKERELIKIVGEELSEGRNCFVYCQFTGDGKNITDRLQTILEDKLDLKGKVEILKASSPSATKRMEWIKEKAEQGIKVVICNPKLVETGLDFIFKYNNRVYNYPSIIFYQLGYNLFTTWQASCRSRRLNQPKLSKVFYLYYKNTMQEAVVELIANKKSATAALQGEFSEAGLMSMANSVDPKVVLANSMMNNSKKDSKINELFDKINAPIDIDLSEEERSLIEKIRKSFMSCEVETTTPHKRQQISIDDISEELLSFISMELKELKVPTGRGNKKSVVGQLSIF